MKKNWMPIVFIIAATIIPGLGCGSSTAFDHATEKRPASPVSDPWFTSGLADYAVLSGAAGTTPLSPPFTGSPTGAHMVYDTAQALQDTSYIAQDIDGAATLPVGTRVTVSGYFYATTRSAGTAQCGSFSATGAYAVGIVTKSGTSASVVTLASGASSGGWTLLSGSIAITTPGAYRAVWIAKENSIPVRVPMPPPNRSCAVAPPITGQGFATDLSTSVVYPSTAQGLL